MLSSESNISNTESRFLEKRNSKFLQINNKNLLNEINSINDKKKIQFQKKKKYKNTINLDYNNPKSIFYKKKTIEKKENDIPKIKLEKPIKKIEEADMNTKIKDLNLIEEIKFKMNKELSDEGKKKYQELLNNIQKLKENDINSYVDSLEKGFDMFKEEINAVEKTKIIENRLNSFIDNLNKDRERYVNKRNYLNNQIKIKDYIVENKLESRRNSELLERINVDYFQFQLILNHSLYFFSFF